VSQHRVLDLERGSTTAASNQSRKSPNQHVHQEEDHRAPILRAPAEAQIKFSDPYSRLAAFRLLGGEAILTPPLKERDQGRKHDAP